MHQRDHFEQFVHGAEAARKRDQRLGADHEVHLAQREVVELEVQLRADVRVRRLLVRQRNVETHGHRATIACAAVRCFHDAGAATSADGERLGRLTPLAVVGHEAAEQARLFVVARIAHVTLRDACHLRVVEPLGVGQGNPRVLGRQEARAAIDDDGVFDAQALLLQIGLEHFELKANATRFAAQQEFGIGEREPVCVGRKRVAVVGPRLHLSPGVGQRMVLDVVCALHRAIFAAARLRSGATQRAFTRFV